MITSLVETVYVGAVPPWLTALVDNGTVTLKALESLPELASILSEQDVSFYYHYSSRTTALTDGVYDGMKPLMSKPDNVEWVTQHSEAIKDAEDVIDLTHFMERCTEETLPGDIRRAYYEPKGLSNSALFLLGRPTSVYDTYIDYFSAAMEQLSNMVGFDQAIHAKVFDAYVAANQKYYTE